MTKVLKIQGIIFAILSLLTVASWSHPPTVSDQSQIIITSILILILGVPHGALDAILAEKALNIKGILGWTVFLVEYCALAGIIVMVAYYVPFVFLAGFLVISVFHFSTDPAPSVPFVSRILYGGGIIFVPAIYYSDEMSRLFALLSGENAAAMIMDPIKLLSVPWFLLLIGAAACQLKADIYAAVEIVAVSILALLVPPLVSFTVYFCFMHSIRHILRSVKITGDYNAIYHVKMIGLPMGGVILTVFVSWFLLKDEPLDQRVIQIAFLGLAALTVPHMVIIERVKLKQGANTKQRGV
ncbi:MAG: Brp/Blh family beta-carotene 15,15'-dioxygenase [Gloeotrichia echinulata HAB0833]